MARVLKEYGPIMRRADFEEHCISAGMKRSTFYVYLDYSPIIERFAAGVYGIRGSEASPGVVESLAPSKGTGRVLLDHGWTSDGRIWIGYRLSDSMLASGVFNVPSGLKRFLEGEFSLRTADGPVTGALVLGSGYAGWGLGSLFRRRGGEAGDILLLRFDLAARDAVAQIGDEGLLDDLQMSTGAPNEPEVSVQNVEASSASSGPSASA
jgi:hypothetical protein